MARYEEMTLQKACVRWFQYQYPDKRQYLHMNHNESKSAADGAQKKSMGLLPGVADLEYIAPGGKAVFIELKWGKNGQSDRQKHFEQKCLERGADYHVVKSLDKFIEIINSYEIKHNGKSIN